MLCISGWCTFAQAQPHPYLNWRLPVEDRVADLVSRMTLEEKVLLLSETPPAIERLHIQKYNYGNEALHGVVRPGKATVFPQAIALAATWDPDLIFRIATAISDEARAKHNESEDVTDQRVLGRRVNGLLTFWSPTLNMARDPRWGRTPETYGEDPFLTARFAVAFVKGLQGNDPHYVKVVATPKHFTANNEEHNRFECKTVISERTLREYYLPGYQAAVVEAKAQSIMSAYNSINGIPCSANKWLLTDILRNEWGFDGYVVTDCGAISHLYDRHKHARTLEQAASMAINAGVDLECGSWCTTPYVFRKYLLKAHDQGLVTCATIDRAVSNVLKLRFRLGMFDPPEIVPYSRIPYETVGSREHVELARQASLESIVLLKNAKSGGRRLLPLDRGSLRTIAVVGPKARTCEFGDYSGNPANPPVTPLDGIQRKAGAKIRVQSVPWASSDNGGVSVSIPDSQLLPAEGKAGDFGLRGQYFDNGELAGRPLSRVDAGIDFDWMKLSPDPLVAGDNFSIRWTGQLAPVFSGDYTLSVTTDDSVRLQLDDRTLIDAWEVKPSPRNAPSGEWTPPVPRKGHTVTVNLEGGRRYDLKIEYCNQGGAFIKLEWLPPRVNHTNRFAREKQAAAESDLAIAVLGVGTDTGMEGLDRKDLGLPQDQQDFIREMASVNPRTIVILVNGSPLAIEWIQGHVPAIVEAWYPGEQGGIAIADVLFGDFNPAGRLPLTFYRSLDQLPPFNDYEVSRGRTYMYLRSEPLYPFGHGLSFTEFRYSNLKLSAERVSRGDNLEISVDVANTGDRDGDEVVQVYASVLHSRVKRPSRELKAFRRVLVPKGKTRTVSLEVPVKDLAYYDEASRRWCVETGLVEFQVGASSSDIRLRQSIVVDGDEMGKGIDD